MANIKARYGEITKQSKLKRQLTSKSKSEAAKEEARLARKIRQRARADFKTVAA